MSLAAALASAMGGLRGGQAAQTVVSSSTASAQTSGSITPSPTQVDVATSNQSAMVPTAGVNRQLDLFIQKQLRTETSGAGYANRMANILSKLQGVYGNTDGGALQIAFSNFTGALQSLSSNPGNASAQSAALSAARSLAARLNTATQGIQTLRSNVDRDIGDASAKANADLIQIADINSRLQGLDSADPTAGTLIGQRDDAISDLSKLVDVRLVTDSSNQASLFTDSGIQLVGQGGASTFVYNSHGPLGASSLYNADPATSGVGSLGIKLPDGSTVDAVASSAVSSGQIAADLKLRDQTLVQAQTQIDQFAATLSSALSDQATAGTPVAGSSSAFDLNTSNISSGNTINLTYTDTTTNTQRQVSIVNVTDPAALPLQNGANANPLLVGANFSLGMASVVSQLNTALASNHLRFSNPSGSTLRVADDGTGASVISAASTITTVRSLAGGVAQLALFTDGNTLYTGAVTANGPQMTGLAGRIAVNPALLADPSKMSVYSTSSPTSAGDTTRADFLLSQLTSATLSYSPQTGLGLAAQPLKATLPAYLQQITGQQANASTLATQLQQGQNVVVSTLRQKSNSAAGINIDSELSSLILVQNNYAANKHIMSVVQSTMQNLLQAA